jgi:UDP-glucose-4-epimerase GalE
VTGGAGYIGSHVCKLLSKNGYTPITIDNLVTGNKESVRWGPLEKYDIRETSAITKLFNYYKPKGVLHFAASAYVGESVYKPNLYYENNIGGSLSLLNACISCKILNFVFSSTCATYGIPNKIPINESEYQSPINPYGFSKLAVERVLQDYSSVFNLKYGILRYFNVAGSDPEGVIGESHYPETHLIPNVVLAAINQSELEIYGNEYETYDGSAIRDYIHVNDLADAHIKALEFIINNKDNLTINLGSGIESSIFDIISAVEETTEKKVKFTVKPKRAGDPPKLVAEIKKAKKILSWQPYNSSLNNIIKDVLTWQKNKYY